MRIKTLITCLLISLFTVPSISCTTLSEEPRYLPEGLVVLFDEAHFPVYSVNPNNPCGSGGVNPSGKYGEFANILKKNSFKIRTLDFGEFITDDVLKDVRVLVIVCSRGENPDGTIEARYMPEELDAIYRFVQNGGGLFLLGDHTSFPMEVEPIGKRFGVEFAHIKLHDPTDYVMNTTAGKPSVEQDIYTDVFIVFQEDNFGNHPIMEGIKRIELYRTDVLSKIPPEGIPLIISDEDTYYVNDWSQKVPYPNKVVSVAIPPGGVAGKGKIVVVADTNTFEVDENRDDDSDMDLYDSDNEHYGLGIIRWLAEYPDVYDVAIYSSEKESYGEKKVVHDIDPGETTVFTFYVENRGSNTDTFNISVSTNAHWDYSLSKSILHLMPNEKEEIYLSVDVPNDASIGSEMECNVFVKSATKENVKDNAVAIARIPVMHNISLICTEPYHKIYPSEYTNYNITVINNGNIFEHVVLRSEAPPDCGAILTTTELHLNVSMQENITLTVIPPRNVLGGDSFRVFVYAELLNGSVMDSVATITEIIQIFKIKIRTEKNETAGFPGEDVYFEAFVDNLGNGNDSVMVSLRGGSEWTVHIEPSIFFLPYCTTQTIEIRCEIPQGTPPGNEIHLEIVAVSLKNSSATDKLFLKVKAEEKRDFHMEFEGDMITSLPGEINRVNLSIINTGNVPISIFIVEWSDLYFISAEKHIISLNVNETKNIFVEFIVGNDVPFGSMHSIEIEGKIIGYEDITRYSECTIIAGASSEVYIEFIPSTIRIVPPEDKEVELKIINIGNVIITSFLEIRGLPNDWRIMCDREIMLSPGDSIKKTVLISSSKTSVCGEYQISASIQYVKGEGELHIDVAPVKTFTMEFRTKTLFMESGEYATGELLLRNTGNTNFTVYFTSAEFQCGDVETPQNTYINFSGEKSVEIKIYAKKGCPDGAYVVTVVAKTDDSKEVAKLLVLLKGSGITTDFPICVIFILMSVIFTILLIKRRKLG